MGVTRLCTESARCGRKKGVAGSEDQKRRVSASTSRTSVASANKEKRTITRDRTDAAVGWATGLHRTVQLHKRTGALPTRREPCVGKIAPRLASINLGAEQFCPPYRSTLLFAGTSHGASRSAVGWATRLPRSIQKHKLTGALPTRLTTPRRNAWAKLRGASQQSNSVQGNFAHPTGPRYRGELGGDARWLRRPGSVPHSRLCPRTALSPAASDADEACAGRGSRPRSRLGCPSPAC